MHNRTNRIGRLAVVLVVAASAMAGCKKKEEAASGNAAPAAAAAEGGKTLANLQAAFNGESNAHAKYLAFAEKADAEGYRDVARLFRAASRAEQVHADHHAEVIRKLGAEPTADVKEAEVKSTAENLQAAIEGETYEKETMYPEFIAAAKEEGQNDAVRVFNFAKAAENDHATFYSTALADLENWKTGDRTFFVCPTCGRTVNAIDFETCSVCGDPAEAYESIS